MGIWKDVKRVEYQWEFAFDEKKKKKNKKKKEDYELKQIDIELQRGHEQVGKQGTVVELA